MGKFSTRWFLLLIALIPALMVAAVIKEGSFQATSDGYNITLRWMVETESNVVSYTIEKRTGTTGEFKQIGVIDPRGISLYEFTDYSDLNKVNSLFQYRIKVTLNNDPNPQYIGPISVTHQVSGVRKTWGSIKALFR